MDSSIEDLKYSQSQCPMNWDIAATRKHAKVDVVVEKFRENLEEKDVGQPWKKLDVLLFLSYENFQSQGNIIVSTYLRQAEEIIKSDLWIRKHYTAAEHVLYSLWAHIYRKFGSHVAARNYISKVKPYEQMSDEDKAFLLALKASFFMLYGPPGNNVAAEIFTEVLKLEQDEPEWYHLSGKCLARVRRIHYRSKPSLEEIAMFKKAVEMKADCARYLIHLARSKADLAYFVRHNQTTADDSKVVEALQTDVESILMKAVRLSVDSAHLICHIAKSIMNLSHFFRMKNLKLTQFCVMKAVEISPSDRLVNHTVGLYHLKNGDVEKAVFFLTEASNMGVYGASFDLCRLKWKECRGYDPVPDLMHIIEHNDQLASSEAHCLLATYYFFVKNDLPSTIKNWKQWLHCREKKHYPISSLFLGQEDFDFTGVLYDEIRLELNSTRYSDLNDRAELEEAGKIIRENRPELQREEPWRQRQHLIDRAQMSSRLGRTFPDSILFLAKERKAKLRGKPFGIKEVTRKNGKKMCVSSKYNAFRRARQPKKNEDKDVKRSQSESRVYEYRKTHQKPFWRPQPKRHASAQNLNANISKIVGSGRVSPSCDFSPLNVTAASVDTLLLVKSYERDKRFLNKENDRSRNSSHNRRFGSQESLASNASSKESYGERRSFNMGSRTRSFDQVSGTARNRQVSTDGRRSPVPYRTPSSEQLPDTRRSSFEKDFSRVRNLSQNETSASCVESPRNWRRGESAGDEPASPRSGFFQSFKTNASSRPSSRSSMGDESSKSQSLYENSRPSSRTSSVSQEDVPPSSFFRNNRGDSFLPPSRSSSMNERNAFQYSTNLSRPITGTSVVRHGDFQSRAGERQNYSLREDGVSRDGQRSPREEQKSQSGERGNYVPRGGSFSRGGQHNSRGQGDFQSRSGGRGNYVPRGGSFSRGGQHNPRGQGDFQSRSGERGNYVPRGGSFSRGGQHNPRGQGDFQSRSGERGNYVPRGDSFSRGGQRNPRGNEVDSKDAFDDAFKRLNFR